LFDEMNSTPDSEESVHFEIGCRDKARTEQFYSKLFDWKLETMGPATMIDTGGAGIAGPITSLGHEPHHYTAFYVQVDDLQAALDKAQELGGKTLVPPPG
jgi:predicted enzyme related to lactoylglutathione lyase